MPTISAYSYHERSMWIVLGRIYDLKFKPIQNMDAANGNEIEAYLNLQRKVLSKGVCICWDLFADVHEMRLRGNNDGNDKRRKRQRKGKIKERTPNDIDSFLQTHPSMEMITFIGRKAHDQYKKLGFFGGEVEARKVDLVALFSSSTATTRMSVEEKTKSWRNQFMQYIPDFME